MKLYIPFQSFGAEYTGDAMRAFIRHLENQLVNVAVRYETRPRTVVSDTDLTWKDLLLMADSTSGNVIVTVPEISDDMVKMNKQWIVKKMVAANTVTITMTGSDTIDGAASKAITTQYQSVAFQAIAGGVAII